MREIKFRAWEKKLKEMIPVYSIDFENGIINTNSVWRFFDEIELMQYTGLKDKNGKEIYEGDIIKYEWDDEYKVDFIEFRGAMFTVSKAARWNYHNDEIIGNIYENPELVKN